MKTVLSVCVHNSGRSQMAEAFFNRLAKGKGKAKSAGTQPAQLASHCQGFWSKESPCLHSNHYSAGDAGWLDSWIYLRLG